MSEPTTAAEAAKENPRSIVEFIPYGTKDKIQLSIQMVKRLIAVKTKSGKTASDEDAFKFMLMCQARRLNPFEGDAFLIGYDGQHGASFSLITAHQAFLKRAELHPEFDGMDSGTIVLRKGEIVDLVGDWHMPEDRILGGWATVWFKNRKHPMKKRVRLERFNKGYGIWKDDPAGMVVKCAEADALRSSFPTMLGGMFTQEEMGPPGTAAEVPRPVFQEPNGATTATATGTVVDVEPEPTPAATPAPEPRQAIEPGPKKSPAQPPGQTLKRKSPSPRSGPTEKSPREKFADLLAVGNCTPQDFVQLALDESWIELEQGTWEKIPDERIEEFMRAENWEFIMKLLDERMAKKKAEAKGNLL